MIVTRSEHIPRIQEAQASAWHVLRGLLEGEGGEAGTAAERAHGDGTPGT